MRRVGWKVLILALALLALASCDQTAETGPTPFEALARWVPGDAQQVFFLDLAPDGQVGRYWDPIRRHLEAHPTGQLVLETLLQQFEVVDYGLDEFIAGSAVNGYAYDVNYVILQVSDEAAMADALRQLEGFTWEQQNLEGQVLSLGHKQVSYQGSEVLAWAMRDGLLYLTSRFASSRSSSAVSDQKALDQLQELLSLAEEDSLATLPSWRALREWLPESPMGLVFFNVAEQARRRSPSPSDTSLGAAMGQNVEALALAALPEPKGMRVEIAGLFALREDAPAELRALSTLPAVAPAAWTALPPNTALALVSHDASLVWPWLRDLFNIQSVDHLRDTIGLDLEADLASADGPLHGEFALGITPPLPDQPISQGLTAGQMLFLTDDAYRAQARDLQAAMEGRGALFGPQEVEGVALQTQVGTELIGYAISHGYEDGTWFLGSSPQIIGQAIVARREDKGLVQSGTFRDVIAEMPDEPSFVAYLNSEPFLSLAQANMTEEQYQNSEELRGLELWEAIALGLQFQRDRLAGVLYFYLPD